jgi:phytoene dehydrogenase-like protein
MTTEKYDVVVIGSGIGGLGAGALLAHRGYKTLMVEQMSMVGGRCSTEEVEGFKLPTGAVALHTGLGMAETFQEVGEEFEITMVPRLFYRIGGEDHEMPTKGSLTMMLDLVNKMEVSKRKLVGGLVKAAASEKIMGAFRKSISEPEKQTMTFRDWLLQYTDSELAHSIFDTICTTIQCGHSYEIPAAAVFPWFTKMGGLREVGLTPHGNLFEMEKLAKVIRKNGDVWTNCTATRIVVEKGRARGVVVQMEGNEIEINSQVVISNAGPRKTVEFAGEDNFTEDYMRTMRLRIRPHPVVMAFVASDRPLWPDDGSPAIMMLAGTRRITSIIPMSSISPECAPPGQHMLFAYASPRTYCVPMDEEEELRQTTLDLQEQLPGLEKHGRILKLDPRNVDREDTATTAWFGMPIETPVKNLYNVGDSMLPLGIVGATGAIDSGRRAAEIVRKAFNPKA